MNLRRPVSHALIATSLAVSAILTLGGAAYADTETGQHGHYQFRDSYPDPGAVCVYAGSNPYRLVQVIVYAPRLWWPDTNSDVTNQHGKVGFRGIIRVSKPGPYGPWAKVKQSEIMTATAYEDNPDYDLNDKAPLSKITFSFDPSKWSDHPNAYVQVRVKAYWYKKSGDVLGTVTHDVYNYEHRNSESNDGEVACQIRMQFI